MKSARTRRAFSLVEVLVALAMLSFGVYGIAGVLSTSQQTAAGADERLQGTALAQLKLEELKGAPALSEAAGPAAGQEVFLPPEGPKVFEQNPRYAWRAALKRDAQWPGRVDLRVDVTRALPAGKASPFVLSATGFVMTPVPAEKGAPPVR